VAAVAGAIQKLDARDVSTDVEVDALCRGAAVLSRESNRIAARALLWAAVAIDPQSFVAHRRLAAALLNAEDVDAAAEEYARFIELLLKEDDVRRAAAELAYARAFLGDMPQLRPAAAHMVPLGDIARALDSSTPPQSGRSPLALADYAGAHTRSGNGNGRPRPARPPAAEATAAQARPHHHWRRWFQRLASELGIGEYLLVISVATAATVLVVFAITALR
jgi:tetratricopeptide (TPR) repeat protein